MKTTFRIELPQGETTMNREQLAGLKAGQTIVYNDGRPGHTDARAVVLEVRPSSMVVSFPDPVGHST